jgi:hypothetical protein
MGHLQELLTSLQLHRIVCPGIFSSTLESAVCQVSHLINADPWVRESLRLEVLTDEEQDRDSGIVSRLPPAPERGARVL